MKRQHLHAAFGAISSIGIGLLTPAHAQSQIPDKAAKVDDTIIVTARRKEERLQDVPISVTVFSQEQIAKRNIVSTTDLVTYTPSLSSNNRFGSDNASYSIRGFTQELRTTASVGVFFADVVAQRAGQTSVTAGDGAGPGTFFDLENVQILKGPQGTLFGRNTTGGAVVLTPRKPVDRFEGYVEGSVGTYGLDREQAVLNLPLSDHVRLRLGVDREHRDGYQRVISGLGPDRLGKIDYITGRASLVVDLAPSLENYTIGSLTRSRGNSLIEALFNCAPVPAPSPPGPFAANGLQIIATQSCQDQLKAHPPGYYDTGSQVSNPISRLNSWQIINTTTWTALDNLTVKNIFSYGQLKTRLRSALFGTDYHIPAFNDVTNAPSVGAGLPWLFANVNPDDNGNSSSQSNMVEELQFQGNVGGDRFTYQAGLYYERSKPISFVGNAANTIVNCPNGGDQSSDPAIISCQDVLRPNLFGGFVPLGYLQISRVNIAYRNEAIYGQATYKFNDHFSFTAGARYTWDRSDGEVSQITYGAFPTATAGQPTMTSCGKFGSPGHPVSLPNCFQSFTQKSKAPTWLLDIDYHPVRDVLLYANYKRGYRQGSVIPIAPDGFETYKPEKVDAYEVGAKTTFSGPLRGYLNVAGFYNNLTNQQIQIGVNSSTGFPGSTTIIANAGKSRIWGVEVDARVMPVTGLSVDVGYAYLNTKLISIVPPNLSGTLYDTTFNTSNPGDPLTFTPRNKVSVTATYQLPLPKSVGDVSVGATYVYTSSQLATTSSPFGILPSFSVTNLNISWEKIAGTPVDAALFVTNLFDKQYASFIGGTYGYLGGETRIPGEPRMLGVRLRYSFGS
jgi:iron complex outermembrane receptor protein